MAKDQKSEIATVEGNTELMGMYQKSAKMGAENLGGKSPLLKIHTTGKSTKNTLADGTRPNDGWFFYPPTGDQWETVLVHILAIGKGFRTDGVDRPNQFNQLMAGIICQDKKTLPFVMYMTGKKLRPMWDFGEEAAKYTRAKPFAIPMFALTVKLSAKSEPNARGESWVPQFEIQKDETGKPILITDAGEFAFYRDSVENAEDMIAAIIDAKSTEEPEEKPIEVTGENFEEEMDKAILTENVDPKEIPI